MTTKLLVVDDEQILRIGTAWTLREFGYEVDEAPDGFIALEKIKAQRYALILMDLNMPAMNGLECTSKIRAWEKQYAFRANVIIALSSSVATNIRSHCIKGGMDEFLDKSCTKEQLRQFVQNFLERVPIVPPTLTDVPNL